MSDTQFARPTGIGEGGRVQFGADDRLWVKFVRKSVRNPGKSDREGRPIYEPVDFVQIQQPGERDMLMRPVREEDKYRWPRLWEAYQAHTEQTPEGSPVQLLFPNEPHIADMMKDLRVLTIEQLAQLSEHGITRLGMDGRRYVAKAQAALDQTAAAREVGRLTRALEEEKERGQLLADNFKLLQDRFDALERRMEEDEEPALPLRRRGRLPKVQVDVEPADTGDNIVG
jgi:hypothetical protein